MHLARTRAELYANLSIAHIFHSNPTVLMHRLLCILLDYQSFLKELTMAPGKQWSTVYRCFQKSPCENLEGHREIFRNEKLLLANYHQTISSANELKRTQARLLADLTVLYNHFVQLALTFSDTKLQQAIEKEAKYLWLYFRTLYDTIFIGKSKKITERMRYTSFIIDALITGN
ncbi:hypothetical protein niasHS_005997 [Heterodera schachtii]|uniref:Uncharacterized protein n=1 Tax=Heterodera schachtii TaxID=97005 RepID=A0ABD2K152_HETSC